MSFLLMKNMDHTIEKITDTLNSTMEKKIIVYPEAKIDSSFLQTLLNFPFACLFAQRGMLPIHASAVRYDKKTILFPGISKVGKSSLAASLIKNNGQLIYKRT